MVANTNLAGVPSMRKQALIHLHSLSIELRSWLSEHHDIDGAFDTYDEEGVSPYEVHRRKRVHREAVRSCFDGVTTVIEDQEPPSRSIDELQET